MRNEKEEKEAQAFRRVARSSRMEDDASFARMNAEKDWEYEMNLREKAQSGKQARAIRYVFANIQYIHKKERE